MHTTYKFDAIFILSIWFIMPCVGKAQNIRPKLMHRTTITNEKKQLPKMWPTAIYLEELNAHNGHPIKHDLVTTYLLLNMPDHAPIWPSNHYPYTGPTAIWRLYKTNRQGRIRIPINTKYQDGGISFFSANHHDCRPQIYDNSMKPHTLTPGTSRVYLLAKIISSGIVAENTCGKAEATPKPDLLIIFVRSFTFWERWRM